MNSFEPEADFPIYSTPLTAHELWSEFNTYLDAVMAMARSHPSESLKAENGMIPPNRLYMTLWDINTRECLLKYETLVQPALFNMLWAQRNPNAPSQVDGVAIGFIDDTTFTTTLRAAAGK